MIIKKINSFLEEDMVHQDITSEATVHAGTISQADIVAMETLIFSGAQIIPHCFDGEIEIKINDGEEIYKGTVIGTVIGNAQSILSRERVMLNIIQRLCGIATHVKKYVDLGIPFKVQILDTRKTTPGMRLFEKYAVKCGGGFNHRFDLSAGVLIKDNHIQSAGSIDAALKKVNQKYWIELEVDTIAQVFEGLKNNVDGFLLDNMDPEQIEEAVSIIRSHDNGNNIFIEASGGINLNNIESYLDTGVNGISIGALTHQIKSMDIKLEFR